MWPPEYIQLKHIDDLMICGICYEYIDTSVITPCSHNYCSLCIRKYLHYKTQCPSCFAETFEKDLRKNKVLDEIIAHFLQIKDKLKKCLKAPLQFLPCNRTDNILNTPKSTSEKKFSPSIKQDSVITNKNIISKSNASPLSQKDLYSPSTSGKSKIPLIFTPKSTKQPNSISTEETKVVICPVCKVTISEAHINRHLDDCLKREAKRDHSQVKADSKRQPIAKLVFSLMKDAVMKKKLKEFGLSSQGDRKTMESRLQRYIILYNAECDKLNPRPISDLIKQCEDEENHEKRNNRASSFLNKLQVNRNTEQNIIDDERKKYLEMHKDSFQSLINKIKRSEPQKNPSVRRNLLNESFEKNKNSVQKNEAKNDSLDDSINDTDKTDLSSMKSNVYIQDSDSDSTCPLQIYSSAEPQKFLNVEFSSSNSNIRNDECEATYKEHNITETEFNRTDCLYLKTEKDDVNSGTVSDISMSHREVHSMLDVTASKDMLMNDSKNTRNASKYKLLLQKKEKLFLKDEMGRIDSVTINQNDFESNSISDQEGIDNEKPASVLQDIHYDLSSNDSIDNKFSSGKLHSIHSGFFNNSVLNSSNIEKENISSSPECSGSRSFRKRSRDLAQNDNKNVSGVKKKIKKVSQPYISETDESAEETVNKPRLRNRNLNTTITEDTTISRKSVRTRAKNNVKKN
ncbi:uncharacterized protein LOC116427854 [Nomia melanderi]|uniref:uncharacterized protein LOC116427854 n=1 Tax=Nomia melanderi TaxID=2448451 RepID=UPI001304708F|nr:E3 ubiquitin-protein ligase RAD18-like [Nomia melanderi]